MSRLLEERRGGRRVPAHPALSCTHCAQGVSAHTYVPTHTPAPYLLALVHCLRWKIPWAWPELSQAPRPHPSQVSQKLGGGAALGPGKGCRLRCVPEGEGLHSAEGQQAGASRAHTYLEGNPAPSGAQRPHPRAASPTSAVLPGHGTSGWVRLAGGGRGPQHPWELGLFLQIL